MLTDTDKFILDCIPTGGQYEHKVISAIKEHAMDYIFALDYCWERVGKSEKSRIIFNKLLNESEGTDLNYL